MTSNVVLPVLGGHRGGGGSEVVGGGWRVEGDGG